MSSRQAHLSRIYAHRGIWANKANQNTLDALETAISLGFSVETDIRDSGGQIVLSHDPAKGHEPRLTELLSLPRRSHLALNVKADGLLSLGLSKQILDNAFVFDCSTPELVRYESHGIFPALRVSEFERQPPKSNRIFWIDGFNSDWWAHESEALMEILDSAREVIFVSPELHGRPIEPAWDWLVEHWKNPRVSICTDFPMEFAARVGRD
ncbi:MAG: hypothetical protein RLZZ249_282 [Actinomycetota bacterium]|jgi:glycerophosphoryl diester phosphodiesterase